MTLISFIRIQRTRLHYIVVSWKDAVTPSDSQGMAGALDPTGAICGPYDEGVGTRVCVDPWLLQPGEKKAKTPLIFSRLIFGRRGVNSFP